MKELDRGSYRSLALNVFFDCIVRLNIVLIQQTAQGAVEYKLRLHPVAARCNFGRPRLRQVSVRREREFEDVVAGFVRRAKLRQALLRSRHQRQKDYAE